MVSLRESTGSVSGRLAVLALLALPALAAAGQPSGPTQPPGVADSLARRGFSPAEVEHVRRGGVISRLLPQREDNAAFIVGLVFVHASPAALLESLRANGTLQPDGRMLQAGRFSSPPVPADLDPVRFEPQDLQDLRKCRVGDCDIRVDEETMAAARKLDWSSADVWQKASQALKGDVLAHLRAYIERGTAGMAVYHEGNTPDESGKELTKLLDQPPSPFPESPAFLRYARDYPNDRPPEVEEFFCWSKQMLRRPILSVVHVSIQTLGAGDGPTSLVALTHVYDSHYFLAHSEFLSLIPEPGGGGFYLVRSVRARIDPPRWFRGMLLGRIKREMRGAMRSDLERLR